MNMYLSHIKLNRILISKNVLLDLLSTSYITYCYNRIINRNISKSCHILALLLNAMYANRFATPKHEYAILILEQTRGEETPDRSADPPLAEQHGQLGDGGHRPGSQNAAAV